MKRIKTFESFNGVETPEETLPVSTNLTEVELTDFLEDLFSQGLDFDTLTVKLREFKDSHPEVKADPNLSKVWFEYIKRWHDMLK